MRRTKKSKRHTRRKTQRTRRFFHKKRGGSNGENSVVAGPLGVMSKKEYDQTMENRDRQGVDY